METAWQSPLPRLLVFDNCEEEELLRSRRPSFGGARVLVTSRKAEWDAALNVKTVPITTLPRPASVELLRRFRPEVPVDDPVLGSIAEELGDLPLALHLAGSFLKMYRSTTFGEPGKYLEALREPNLLDHPSLMGQGAGASPTGHSADVGRTFALSFERLEPTKAADATAIRLLARAAWFAPGEPIPRSLLLRSAGVNSEALSEALNAEDALRRLTDLGLLEMDERNDPRMHRLVAAWAVGGGEGDSARASVEEVWIAEAARLNEIANPAALRSWLPHLRAVTDRARDREDSAAALLCDELGIHLWHAGDYFGAQPYLERAVALHEAVSGPEDPATARSLNVLGCVFRSQGNYQKAQTVHERALGIREQVLGLEHPDTAESLNDLGIVLFDQGNHDASRLAQERALAIREKAFGLEHRDTALSLDNLGAPLQDLGDLAGSLSCRERALAIREKVLGPEHPHTALSLNSLGGLLLDLGNSARARAFYERALTIREKVLGPEHPDTATSLSNLGALLYRCGEWIGARSYVEQALAIREKVLGPEHVDTANSLLNLGTLFFRQGNSSKARALWERALRIFDSRLGPNHPDTKKARMRLRDLPGARRNKKRRS